MKTFIDWDPIYSVGVKLIDFQHKKLFLLINELYNAVNKTDGEVPEPIEAIILDLASYVEFHFGTEEGYFKEFGYEKIAEHTEQHHFYERGIKEFNEKYKEKGDAIGEEILVFLKNWISNHIQINDKEYEKCFNDHGLS